MSDPKILDALRSLAVKNDGLLLPEHVVKAARPKTSPLHSSFCWDDDEAARQYRLWQARTLIRTTVETISVEGKDRDVRVFVSLTPDRDKEGGGYRELVAVMSNPSAREILLSDALSEMRTFQKKYQELRELAEIFGAAKRIREKRSRHHVKHTGSGEPDEVTTQLNEEPKSEVVRLLSSANGSIVEARSLMLMLKLDNPGLDKQYSKSLNSLGELRFMVNEILSLESAA